MSGGWRSVAVALGLGNKRYKKGSVSRDSLAPTNEKNPYSYCNMV